LPAIDDEIGVDYLNNALRRAGRKPPAGDVASFPVGAGNSGARVVGISGTDAGRFVLKKIRNHPNSWWSRLVGSSSYEVDLWRSGVTRNLPAPLGTPTLDIAYHTRSNEWWILMEDVSAHRLTAANFDSDRFSWIFDGLNRFHDNYLDPEKIPVPICSLKRHAEVFIEPMLVAAGRERPHEWLKLMGSRPRYSESVPKMEKFFGAKNFDFYLDLGENRDQWLAALSAFPATLLHGDLQWGHMALVSPRKCLLIDWNMPVLGPPAADMAWCWFLDFWCFPPRDGLPPEARDALRNKYLRSLREDTGWGASEGETERSWHLSWLRAFVELGWCLAMPSVAGDQADQQNEIALKCDLALDQAKYVVDKYL